VCSRETQRRRGGFAGENHARSPVSALRSRAPVFLRYLLTHNIYIYIYRSYDIVLRAENASRRFDRPVFALTISRFALGTIGPTVGPANNRSFQNGPFFVRYVLFTTERQKTTNGPAVSIRMHMGRPRTDFDALVREPTANNERRTSGKRSLA